MRRLTGFAVTVAAAGLLAVSVAAGTASAVAPAPVHRGVTVRCFPDNSTAAFQAEVLINNHKRHATGLMHGFTVTAVTRTGVVMRWSEGGFFRIPPRTQWGWFPAFPHHVRKCSAVIRWVPAS